MTKEEKQIIIKILKNKAKECMTEYELERGIQYGLLLAIKEIRRIKCQK